MALDFGGTPIEDPVLEAEEIGIELLQLAVNRLRQGFPKAAMSYIHDAVFEIANTHSINEPF